MRVVSDIDWSSFSVNKAFWLVEPTHLKKYKSNWIISPNRDGKINNISKHHPDLFNPFFLLKSSFRGQGGYDCSWSLQATNAVTWKQKMQTPKPQSNNFARCFLTTYDLPRTAIMWQLSRVLRTPNFTHSTPVPFCAGTTLPKATWVTQTRSIDLQSLPLPNLSRRLMMATPSSLT